METSTRTLPSTFDENLIPPSITDISNISSYALDDTSGGQPDPGGTPMDINIEDEEDLVVIEEDDDTSGGQPDPGGNP